MLQECRYCRRPSDHLVASVKARSNMLRLPTGMRNVIGSTKHKTTYEQVFLMSLLGAHSTRCWMYAVHDLRD